MNVLGISCLLLTTILATSSAKPRSQDSVCEDRYLWIADGSVDCKYLKTESFWGLHNNPAHWCNEYVFTDCCATCNELRTQGVIG